MIALAVIALVFFHHSRPTNLNESLPISESVIAPKGVVDVRVVDTVPERNLGLSYFKNIPKNQGMLFIFDAPGIYPFWMKGMNFPLDMVWLNYVSGNSYEVMSITQDAMPASYPKTFSSSNPIDAVLEINAFQAESLGMVEGEMVRIVSN